MHPIVTAREVQEFDRGLAEARLVDATIERVGFAVARAALGLLGRAYGKRVAILQGPGNNGRDGAAAGRYLAARGVRVETFSPAELAGLRQRPGFDLVVDALFGTGLARAFQPPELPEGVPVLAVDIPSGLDADSGLCAAGGGALRATVTVAVGTLKPGHLINEGPEYCGSLIRVLPDLCPEEVRWQLADPESALASLPVPARESHKWSSTVMVVGGSIGMRGAPLFSSMGAYAAGAGMVHLYTRLEPGESPGLEQRPEVVVKLVESFYAEPVVKASQRFKALVVGPGAGTSLQAVNFVRRIVAGSGAPVVLDADGLTGFGDGYRLAKITRNRSAATVITPHCGEFSKLFGDPGTDPIGAALAASADTGCVILLKGSPTVVASPDGRVVIAASGSARLAMAGTGDVLAGLTGGLLAQGMGAFEAAWVAAEIHGIAGAGSGSRLVGVADLASAISNLVGSAVAVPRHPGAEIGS